MTDLEWKLTDWVVLDSVRSSHDDDDLAVRYLRELIAALSVNGVPLADVLDDARGSVQAACNEYCISTDNCNCKTVDDVLRALACKEEE